MIGLIACAVALAAGPPASPSTYAEARASAGRSPDDQVRLALWCEARGLSVERLHHLTLAVLADPGHAAARGLMGMVALDGRWARPGDSIAARPGPDPVLAEYEARRLRSPETAEGHLTLGAWADDRGLADQARAHLTAATRLDPSLAEAWRRLGYQKRDGRWVTEAQLAAERVEADARRQADRRWKPFLEECRRLLAIPARRAEAEGRLEAVTDPRAVPSIGRVFAATEPLQPRAVRLLGQIDAPESTRALASLAAFARSPQARRDATETLRRRSVRDYAEPLIALLGEPVRFEVKHVAGPDSPGELLVEGKRANLRRVYAPPSPFRPGDRLGSDPSGLPVVIRRVEPGGSARITVAALFGDFSFEADRVVGIEPLRNPGEIGNAARLVGADLPFRSFTPATRLTVRFGETASIPFGRIVAEAEKSAEVTERTLRADVRALEDHNLAVRMGNDRVAGVLNDATGQSLPPDRRAWAGWYLDHVGYSTPSAEWTDRPAATEPVAIAYRSPVLPEGSTREVVGYERVDCFAAGTLVQALDGPRPIERLKVGDRVLAQDPATGTLGYRPVLATHRHPALPTCRVTLRGEAIVATPVHRFWVAGRGWAMARDLKPGELVRVLGGVAPVESVEPDAVRPAYNLDVADLANYFAGRAAALVKDNMAP